MKKLSFILCMLFILSLCACTPLMEKKDTSSEIPDQDAQYPAKVDTANRCNNTLAYEELNVNYCMECGSCSFVCPAKRPLTQIMRVAKAEMRRNAK